MWNEHGRCYGMGFALMVLVLYLASIQDTPELETQYCVG